MHGEGEGGGISLRPGGDGAKPDEGGGIRRGRREGDGRQKREGRKERRKGTRSLSSICYHTESLRGDGSQQLGKWVEQ